MRREARMLAALAGSDVGVAPSPNGGLDALGGV
jgi:hypothetical protein